MAAKRHREPTGHADNDFLERERDAGPGHAKCHGEPAQTVAEDHAHEKQGDRIGRNVHALVRAVPHRGILDPPGQGALRQADRRANRDQADGQEHQLTDGGVKQQAGEGLIHRLKNSRKVP